MTFGWAPHVVRGAFTPPPAFAFQKSFAVPLWAAATPRGDAAPAAYANVSLTAAPGADFNRQP